MHRGPQGYTVCIHRGTQGYTGVHRGMHGYTGVHRGCQGYTEVHRGTQDHTGVCGGTYAYIQYTGVQRSAQAEALVDKYKIINDLTVRQYVYGCHCTTVSVLISFFGGFASFWVCAFTRTDASHKTLTRGVCLMRMVVARGCAKTDSCFPLHRGHTLSARKMRQKGPASAGNVIIAVLYLGVSGLIPVYSRIAVYS